MKLRNIGISMLFLLLFAAAVRYRQEVTAAILDAGSRCILVIVPSLYFFSILAAFCVRSGVLEILAAPLHRFARRILRMDGSILMTLLFSQTAGYPIGAQLLQRLYEKEEISRQQRNCLLCVCFGCGPAFLLGTVGSILHLSPKLSAVLQLSVALPNFVLALIFAYHSPFCSKAAAEHRLSLNAAELTESVETAAAAMLKICSMILAFAAFSGISEGSGILRSLSVRAAAFGISADTAKAFLLCVLEISSLPVFLQEGGSLPMAAALLSFGGICVHLQNAAICGGAFPWRRFLCVRLVSAVCSYLLCTAAVNWCFDGQHPVMLLLAPRYEAGVTAPIPVVCLLVMSVFLLRKNDGLLGAKKIEKIACNLSADN